MHGTPSAPRYWGRQRGGHARAEPMPVRLVMRGIKVAIGRTVGLAIGLKPPLVGLIPAHRAGPTGEQPPERGGLPTAELQHGRGGWPGGGPGHGHHVRSCWGVAGRSQPLPVSPPGHSLGRRGVCYPGATPHHPRLLLIAPQTAPSRSPHPNPPHLDPTLHARSAGAAPLEELLPHDLQPQHSGALGGSPFSDVGERGSAHVSWAAPSKVSPGACSALKPHPTPLTCTQPVSWCALLAVRCTKALKQRGQQAAEGALNPHALRGVCPQTLLWRAAHAHCLACCKHRRVQPSATKLSAGVLVGSPQLIAMHAAPCEGHTYQNQRVAQSRHTHAPLRPSRRPHRGAAPKARRAAS